MDKPRRPSRLLVWGWTLATTLAFIVLTLGLSLLPFHFFYIILTLSLAWIVVIFASHILLPERVTYALFHFTLPSILAMAGAMLTWLTVATLIEPKETDTTEILAMAAIAQLLLLFGSYHVTDLIFDEAAITRANNRTSTTRTKATRRNLFEDCNISDPTSLIRFQPIDTKEIYLGAFWRWVELMADDRYDLAAKAFLSRSTWTADGLKERVTTFFGGDAPWHVVIPNDRLIGVINDNTTYSPMDDERGWFMAQIPLTTETDDPKADDIPLVGVAVSFFVLDRGDHYELFFEIFHI